MNIKQIFSTILLSVISVFSFANTPSDTDLELLEYGIVDSSFKYKDLELATEYFKIIHHRNMVSLPLYIDKHIEWTSSLITPFEQVYSYKDYRIEDDDKIIFEKSDILEFCDETFTDLYLIRNNVNINIRYYNINDKLISTINLNRKTCS